MLGSGLSGYATSQTGERLSAKAQPIASQFIRREFILMLELRVVSRLAA